MNSSGEAAESVVRISMEGMVRVLSVVGTASKEVMALLLALSKDHTKTKGKTSLAKMLKSGKEIKVFSIKQEDLKKFAEEAKRYGVLYHAIINKKDKNPNSLIDIMVKAEDASKVNRIVERFNLYTTNNATIKNEIEKEQAKANEKKEEQERAKEQKEEQSVDDIMNDIMSINNKEEQEDIDPTLSSQSDPSYENKVLGDFSNEQEKPSVKEQLKEIKKQQEKDRSNDKDKDKDNVKNEGKKNNNKKTLKSKKKNNHQNISKN